MKSTHCLVFDIGKTNKKCLVFDEDYRVVWEKSAVLPETTDDDGFPCDDLQALARWVRDTLQEAFDDPRFDIRAANCTAYGASFVHLGAGNEPAAPLYNYLKPFPEDLLTWFLEKYGPAQKLSLETASPLLGYLNSGLQLLWLKYHKPALYRQINTSLHLPQWVASLLNTARPPSPVRRPPSLVPDLTSLGCHTLLWDFRRHDYHAWAQAEGLPGKLLPLGPGSGALGLHDSSAALIPYLASFPEPFALLSTGTWCITLNPFNAEPLTPAELEQDCLCYLTAEGRPVKAARYFGGHEHAQGVLKIARAYGLPDDFYHTSDAGGHPNAREAYAAFMRDLVEKQVASTRLALGASPVRRLFVDGGFSKNALYMRLLAEAFPGMDVCAADVAQATALGAALADHARWNPRPRPSNLITLKKYAV